MNLSSVRKLRLATFGFVSALYLSTGAAASAQEFRHTFVNPSFGGNPFNSDHLLGIAGLDRPDAPEDAPGPIPTPEELLISQLQAQLTATQSSNILRAIQSAQPGQSGSFTLGDTLITFVRTATETRVTFANSKTGETREIVIPVDPVGNPFGSTGAALVSAERALAVTGRPAPASTGAPSRATGESGILLSPPPL